jgi:glycosyltransferase involved in cell wall biosynthesis
VQALARRLDSSGEKSWPDQPVPVALVITDLDVGGAERTLVALATGLDRRRWEPSVIALGPEGALAEPLRAAGIDTRCLGAEKRRPAQAVLRLAGALRARSPELIQSFMFHANIAAKLAAPLAGSPWVVGGLRVAERHKLWHLSLDRWTSWLGTGSVCVSEGVRQFSRSVGRLNDERLVVIPNAVDPTPFDRAEPANRASLGLPEDAFLALFVGRLDPQKGLPHLITAAEVVVRARPGWHLALAGDGPDRDRLVAQAASAPGLAGHFHWLGRRDDVPSLLKAADLLVLPSLWEGMPNVVLEAMAARRAVVATAVEGTDELVVPGETGWLIPPADPGALASALIEAAYSPDRTQRFGEAGRSRVEVEFALERMVAAYDRLWARILGFELGSGEGRTIQ